MRKKESELPEITETGMVRAMTAALNPDIKEYYDRLADNEKEWYEDFLEEIRENREKGIKCSYDIPYN